MAQIQASAGGCSIFFNFASKMKGPKGRIDAIKPSKNIFKDHFCFSHTANSTARNPINSSPCPMPMYLTKIGLSSQYFMGMAINSNNRKEMPSSAPTMRKVWIFMVTALMRMNPECTEFKAEKELYLLNDYDKNQILKPSLALGFYAVDFKKSRCCLFQK